MSDYDLEPAKKILRTFLKEIEKIRALLKNVSAPKPALSFAINDRTPVFDASEFDPASDDYWEKENAYIWLYGDAWNFRSLMHLPKLNGIPAYYNQPAHPVYELWLQEDKDLFYRKCEQIPSPRKELSLADYLQQLALTTSEGNEHRDVWIESLRCFLQFLREDTDLDQRGFLERLFPSKDSCKGMEFRKGSLPILEDGKTKKIEQRFILRRIEDSVYPIDILAASEILIHLAKAIFEGRPNSQRSAAEALGFAWLCHAVGCYRLVTRENLVFSTKVDKFRTPDLKDPKQRLQPTHFIGVDSLYGVIDVPISKTIYEYLLALPRDLGNIFSMDWKTLLRTFHNKGVKKSARATNLGQITFLTFMSQPHEAIGHRPSPNKKTVTHRPI
ncbi:MAG: hypothetical protein JSR85_08390 [Proteobacteria bacterium]|nr:hypothetical protein [Pseudomonadota bacterium]